MDMVLGLCISTLSKGVDDSEVLSLCLAALWRVLDASVTIVPAVVREVNRASRSK